VSIVGAIGYDFPKDYHDLLAEKLDIKGLTKIENKKTFFYDSSFDFDLSHRTTNVTELNAIEDFEPTVPIDYQSSEFIYLANNDPDQNLKILKSFYKPKLVICDTIEYWILNKKDSVISMMEKTNGVIINDQEARLLCGSSNLIKCGKQILSLGPDFVMVKKGEHGVLFFYNESDVIPIPGYPLEGVVDPTGAGDSFAGGFMGYLASKCKGHIFDDLDLVKESILFGSVMGTFAIEDFGINKLISIDIKDVLDRYGRYKSLLTLR
jgi:sugar/nucleoside kinase (ribokinase family)